jgi:hypothetical protein
MPRSREILVAVAFLIVGVLTGAYWGEHYSRVAVALRRTRQTICPSVPADTPMKAFPKTCLDAMIPKAAAVRGSSTGKNIGPESQ